MYKFLYGVVELFNLMEFFKDIFAKEDNSLVGLRRLHDVKVVEKPKLVKPARKEYKLSELMKKGAVE